MSNAPDKPVEATTPDFQAPWRPIDKAPKNGRPVLLLVDYTADDADHAVEDQEFGRTIGHNNDDLVGEGEGQGWQFAGWCWSHDHYTEGKGRAVAFIELDAVAPAVES